MRTANRLALGLALCFFSATFVVSQTPGNPPGPAQSANPMNPDVLAPRSTDLVAPLIAGEEYLLGPGDVISVSLYGEPDMARDCSIRGGDGTIFLPMLREKIHAAGKTTEQLQQVIEEAYRAEKLYKNPLVTVTIKEFRSSPVTVTGYVSRPVTIQVQGRTTLLQAVSMAGGLSPTASTKILVSHAAASTDASGAEAASGNVTITLHDLMNHPEDPKVNVVLRGGDIVTVQRTDYVYVGGAVAKPGMLAMNEVEDWTVLKALAAVGNLTKVAKKDAVVIVRPRKDGTKEQIPLDLDKIQHRKAEDVSLYANDILLIPESGGLKAMYAAAQTISSAAGVVVGGLAVH
jgi:polysaccharide export outer membrane protein